MFTFRQEGRVNSANLSSLGRVESLAADWSKETSKQTFAIQPPDLSPMANTQADLLPSRTKSEEERKRLDSPTERFGDKGSPALRLLHQNEEVVQDPKQQIDKKKSQSKKESRSNRLSNSMKPRQQSKTSEQVDSANLLESDKFSKVRQVKEGEEPLSSFLVPRMKSISNVVPSNEEEPKDQEEMLPSALVSGHSAAKRKRDKGKEKQQEGIKEAHPKKSSRSKTDGQVIGAKKKEAKEGKKDRDQDVETEEAEYEAEASKRRAERRQRRREKASIVQDRSRPISARLKSEMKKKERSEKRKRNNPSENSSDRSSSISTHSVETKKKKKKVKDRNSKNLEESARLAREFEPLKGRIGKGRLTQARSATGLFSHGAASSLTRTGKKQGKGELAFSESQFLRSFSSKSNRKRSHSKDLHSNDDSNPKLKRKIHKGKVDSLMSTSDSEVDSEAKASSDRSHSRRKLRRTSSGHQDMARVRSSSRVSQVQSISFHRSSKGSEGARSVSTELDQVSTNSRRRRECSKEKPNKSSLSIILSHAEGNQASSESEKIIEDQPVGPSKVTEASTRPQPQPQLPTQRILNQSLPPDAKASKIEETLPGPPQKERTEAEIKLLSTYLHGNGPSQANGWRAQHTVPMQPPSPSGPILKIKLDSESLERRASDLYQKRRTELELLEGLEDVTQSNEEAFNQDRSSSPLGRLIRACDDGIVPNLQMDLSSSSFRDSSIDLEMRPESRTEGVGDFIFENQAFASQSQDDELDLLEGNYSESQMEIGRPVSAGTMKSYYYHNQKDKSLVHDPAQVEAAESGEEEDDELDLLGQDQQYHHQDQDAYLSQEGGDSSQVGGARYPIYNAYSQDSQYGSDSPDPLLLDQDYSRESPNEYNQDDQMSVCDDGFRNEWNGDGGLQKPMEFGETSSQRINLQDDESSISHHIPSFEDKDLTFDDSRRFNPGHSVTRHGGELQNLSSRDVNFANVRGQRHFLESNQRGDHSHNSGGGRNQRSGRDFWKPFIC